VKKLRLAAFVGSLLLPLGVLPGTTPEAGAFRGILNEWQDRYGAVSASGDSAGCQLCHADANGGGLWNAYGWDLLLALGEPECDFNMDGSISDDEAFFCIELDNSDGDTGPNDNVTEIGLSTQPGWTVGESNPLYNRSGATGEIVFPPGDIGPVDPDGTEPPPPPPPPPPDDDADLPFGQHVRKTIVVRPGQSIQAAINQARPGATIRVLAGTYRETADPINGLTINKGIRLIGQTNPSGKRVVLQNAGNQRNGIVAVPADRNDCMACHESLAPPFKLKPEFEDMPVEMEPVIHDLEIRGIDIEGFVNNGLFTERVDGFKIVDVEIRGSKNYGIFPTISKNGLITHSRAFDADDSGIWVETSENVEVVHNFVSNNVNGFEVSNSDDVLLAHNVATKNSVGFAILLLPEIYDIRAGAKRIDMRDNVIVDNNKPNTAPAGTVLAEVPAGTGIIHVGADQSEITGNHVEDNHSVGIALVDYCLAVLQTDFACFLDPTVTPPFLADSPPRRNRVVGNTLVNNGTEPDPEHPFAFTASDLILLAGEGRNCWSDNEFDTLFTLSGEPLPACEDEE
jgi:parallel beta-helix repeat protein